MKRILISLFISIPFLACSQEKESLKEKFQDYFLIGATINQEDYQIIDKDNVLEFRKKVNEKLLSFIKENLPSLAESDKSLPPNDWIN